MHHRIIELGTGVYESVSKSPNQLSMSPCAVDAITLDRNDLAFPSFPGLVALLSVSLHFSWLDKVSWPRYLHSRLSCWFHC